MQVKSLCLILSFITLFACSSMEKSLQEKVRRQQQKVDVIYRLHSESFFDDKAPPLMRQREEYPWEKSFIGQHPRITKEFFRCRGSYANIVNIIPQENKEPLRYDDCEGFSSHGLPIHDGKEFIYPTLIRLLNIVQEQTQKRVVLTSGHRCPQHNAYVDPSKFNQMSKHMIGAEVDFYVKGLEENPEKVIQVLIDAYKGRDSLENFTRYSKETDVSTLPWMNKEIFIKLYKKKEGRNVDNRHPYPYICIQIRYDFVKNERVNYSWEKAFRAYARW